MAIVPDSHIYLSVGFSPEGLRLFVNALRYYADRLDADLKEMSVDPLLATVLDEASLQSFPIARETEELRSYAERFEEMVPRAVEWGVADTNLSHGLVRRLKAIAELYLSELERRRDKVASVRSFTTLGLQALDTRLTQWREKVQMGVFRDTEPATLLVNGIVAEPDTASAPQPVAAKAQPLVAPLRGAATIEILDPELRERCSDLFNIFDQSKQTHRFDTVISEATRVLEDRVRKRAGLRVELIGMELMSEAFGPSGKLVLSAVENEQSAAHLLFRGTVGFIRNPVQHQLVSQLERERVMQILGYVDCLLYLTDTATNRSGSLPGESADATTARGQSNLSSDVSS